VACCKCSSAATQRWALCGTAAHKRFAMTSRAGDKAALALFG
jgi:hypothetical protein